MKGIIYNTILLEIALLVTDIKKIIRIKVVLHIR